MNRPTALPAAARILPPPDRLGWSRYTRWKTIRACSVYTLRQASGLFSRYQRQHDTITALENSLLPAETTYSKNTDLSRKKNSHARNKLHFLTKEVLRREAADLNSLLEAASGIIPPRRYSILSADDLAALCRDISPHAKRSPFSSTSLPTRYFCVLTAI